MPGPNNPNRRITATEPAAQTSGRTMRREAIRPSAGAEGARRSASSATSSLNTRALGSEADRSFMSTAVTRRSLNSGCFSSTNRATRASLVRRNSGRSRNQPSAANSASHSSALAVPVAVSENFQALAPSTATMVAVRATIPQTAKPRAAVCACKRRRTWFKYCRTCSCTGSRTNIGILLPGGAAR